MSIIEPRVEIEFDIFPEFIKVGGKLERLASQHGALGRFAMLAGIGLIVACDARLIGHLRLADDRPVLAELDAKDRHQLCNVLAARGRVPAALDLLANRLRQPRRRLGADLPRRGPFLRIADHAGQPVLAQPALLRRPFWRGLGGRVLRFGLFRSRLGLFRFGPWGGGRAGDRVPAGGRFRQGCIGWRIAWASPAAAWALICPVAGLSFASPTTLAGQSLPSLLFCGGFLGAGLAAGFAGLGFSGAGLGFSGAGFGAGVGSGTGSGSGAGVCSSGSAVSSGVSSGPCSGAVRGTGLGVLGTAAMSTMSTGITSSTGGSLREVESIPTDRKPTSARCPAPAIHRARFSPRSIRCRQVPDACQRPSSACAEPVETSATFFNPAAFTSPTTCMTRP